jgi:hypothetical protein
MKIREENEVSDNNMKILLSYYSKEGHTEKLANIIREALKSRGHDVECEIIKPTNLPSKWGLVLKCIPGIPRLLFSTFVFRLRRFYQYEVEIEPLKHPDASRFDCIIIGGPKWMHLSFPVARYLKQVKGLSGKKVAGFATFAAPPFEHYQMYAYFHPFNMRVRGQGGRVIARLGVSTTHQDYPLIMPMYRLFSFLRFGKSVDNFLLGTEWAKEETARFCRLVEAEDSSIG